MTNTVDTLNKLAAEAILHGWATDEIEAVEAERAVKLLGYTVSLNKRYVGVGIGEGGKPFIGAVYRDGSRHRLYV